MNVTGSGHPLTLKRAEFVAAVGATAIAASSATVAVRAAAGGPETDPTLWAQLPLSFGRIYNAPLQQLPIDLVQLLYVAPPNIAAAASKVQGMRQSFFSSATTEFAKMQAKLGVTVGASATLAIIPRQDRYGSDLLLTLSANGQTGYLYYNVDGTDLTARYFDNPPNGFPGLKVGAVSPAAPLYNTATDWYHLWANNGGAEFFAPDEQFAIELDNLGAVFLHLRSFSSRVTRAPKNPVLGQPTPGVVAAAADVPIESYLTSARAGGLIAQYAIIAPPVAARPRRRQLTEPVARSGATFSALAGRRPAATRDFISALQAVQAAPPPGVLAQSDLFQHILPADSNFSALFFDRDVILDVSAASPALSGSAAPLTSITATAQTMKAVLQSPKSSTFSTDLSAITTLCDTLGTTVTVKDTIDVSGRRYDLQLLKPSDFAKRAATQNPPIDLAALNTTLTAQIAPTISGGPIDFIGTMVYNNDVVPGYIVNPAVLAGAMQANLYVRLAEEAILTQLLPPVAGTPDLAKTSTFAPELSAYAGRIRERARQLYLSRSVSNDALSQLVSGYALGLLNVDTYALIAIDRMAHAQGYRDGYSSGYSSGYATGVTDGAKQAYNALKSALGSTVPLPDLPSNPTIEQILGAIGDAGGKIIATIDDLDTLLKSANDLVQSLQSDLQQLTAAGVGALNGIQEAGHGIGVLAKAGAGAIVAGPIGAVACMIFC